MDPVFDPTTPSTSSPLARWKRRRAVRDAIAEAAVDDERRILGGRELLQRLLDVQGRAGQQRRRGRDVRERADPRDHRDEVVRLDVVMSAGARAAHPVRDDPGARHLAVGHGAEPERDPEQPGEARGDGGDLPHPGGAGPVGLAAGADDLEVDRLRVERGDRPRLVVDRHVVGAVALAVDAEVPRHLVRDVVRERGEPVEVGEARVVRAGGVVVRDGARLHPAPARERADERGLAAGPLLRRERAVEHASGGRVRATERLTDVGVGVVVLALPRV